MAKRKPKPEHHSQAQRREQKTNEFRSRQSDEQLYKLVAAVARDALPDAPGKLGQQQFDDNRERIAGELGEPVPPKANAIYMRFNQGRPKRERRPWKRIVADALDGNHELRVTADRRAEPAWFQDEGYLVYSLRRVADHLGLDPGGPGCPADTYDRGYRELVEADKRLKRGRLLGELLLTSAQAQTIAGNAGWDGAWELAGYLPPGRPESVRGFEPLQMLAHYYETRPGLPRSYEELRQHAASMDIPLPAQKTVKWTELRARFIALRHASGLETPRSGPRPGEELPSEKVAALLEGAPRLRRKGYWLVLDNVLDALADYVDEYEGREPLRQHHYKAACVGRGWPSATRIDTCARKHGIGVGTGDGPFRAMLELARKRAHERRQKAA